MGVPDTSAGLSGKPGVLVGVQVGVGNSTVGDGVKIPPLPPQPTKVSTTRIKKMNRSRRRGRLRFLRCRLWV